MARVNWIYTYYQGIKDGTFAVGKWVKLAYEMIIKGLEGKSFFYDYKKADAVIEYFESHVFHTEGSKAPSALQLEVWQKAFLAATFGIVDEKGNRQFREIFLLVGRKQGKTKLGSGSAKYVWEREGYGSKIFCVAPKLDQADLVYNDVWIMETLDPDYIKEKKRCEEKDSSRKKLHDDSNLPRHRMTDLFIPSLNATVKKIAFSAKKSDGFNPSLCICDEVAAWEGDKGLKQYEVMKSGMGAREEGLLMSLTTAGYINDGIYDELMKRSTRVLLGDSKERRLLPILYMIDDVEKWNDINELRKSLPNLGVSVSVDYMLEEIAIAEGSLSKKAEFLCKYGCIKQNSSLAWLSVQDVEGISGEPITPESLRSSYAVGGLDLSQTTDLTCATLVVEKKGTLKVLSHFWMPAEKLELATERDGVPYSAYIQKGFLSLSGENYVDYHDVEEWFNRMLTEFEIYPLKIGYDRYSAQYLVKDMSQRYHMDDVYQGDNLHPVLIELEGIIKDKTIDIGDNDLLKVHLLNSAIKVSAERGRGRLVKINPTARIDGTAALVDAMAVRQKWFAEIGGQLENE